MYCIISSTRKRKRISDDSLRRRNNFPLMDRGKTLSRRCKSFRLGAISLALGFISFFLSFFLFGFHLLKGAAKGAIFLPHPLSPLFSCVCVLLLYTPPGLLHV